MHVHAGDVHSMQALLQAGLLRGMQGRPRLGGGGELKLLAGLRLGLQPAAWKQRYPLYTTTVPLCTTGTPASCSQSGNAGVGAGGLYPQSCPGLLRPGAGIKPSTAHGLQVRSLWAVLNGPQQCSTGMLPRARQAYLRDLWPGWLAVHRQMPGLADLPSAIQVCQRVELQKDFGLQQVRHS